MDYLRPTLDSLLIDFDKVEWKQFTQINNFQWEIGKTPFSQFGVPVFGSFFYLISLLVLHIYMKEKKAMVLKGFTFVHNVILTLLSLTMFIGASYGAILKYKSQGFWAGLVCEQDPEPIKGPLFYWSYIFYLSKFYEFIDSYLLVVKKKQLIFLHVFHHFVMPYVCWAGLEGKWCLALWTSAFWNSFVHVFMYYYYSVATLGYSPWWRKHLTALQIYQFVSGVVYTSVFFYYYMKNVSIIFQSNQYVPFLVPQLEFTKGCTGELWAVVGMFSVNCSFLVLFANFFVQQYLDKPKNIKKE